MQSTNLGYTYSLTYTHVCLFVFSSVVLSHVWICGSTTTIQILNSTRILLVALVNSDTHFPPTIPLLSLAPNWFATSKKA